jgi:putative zinc finger protein
MTGHDPAGQTDMCDSKELLVSFLYDEIDPAAKRQFQKHLATCIDCRDELAELGAARAQIAMWTPPDADLGFRIVREAESRKRRWFQWSPAWGLAAAAVVLLAVSAAIANLDIRYGDEGLVVRTGWNHGADTAQQSAATNVTPVDWKAQADQLDRRLRELEQAMSSRQGSAVQNASTSDMSNDALLQRVRDIVGQSETRQQRAFTARLVEMTREFDARRQLDLATIDQGMTRLQNTSGAELRQYRELVNRQFRQAAYQQEK